MKVVQKYFIREFFRILAIATLGLATVFSILDLLDKVDDLARGLNVLNVCIYIFLSMPKYLYYLLPMSLLICALFVFGQASRHKELVALKATGGRLRKLFYPFLLLGVLFSFVSLAVGEIVIPDFAGRTLALKRHILQKGENVGFEEGALWVRAADGSLVRMELYMPKEGIVRNISIFSLGEGMVRQRVEAESALWVGSGDNGRWRLTNVTIYDLEKETVRRVPEMSFPYLEAPDFFRKVTKKPEEMGIGELYNYTQRLQAAGFTDRRLLVDLNAKISYPIANFFMILLGLSLAVMSRAGGGLFTAGIGIAISFLYWLGYTFTLSMGYAGVIPAFAAPWSMPALFGITAFYLFHRLPE
ncbi:MAG: LptF/LptG family permease [Nitrospirota bacterium]